MHICSEESTTVFKRIYFQIKPHSIQVRQPDPNLPWADSSVTNLCSLELPQDAQDQDKCQILAWPPCSSTHLLPTTSHHSTRTTKWHITAFGAVLAPSGLSVPYSSQGWLIACLQLMACLLHRTIRVGILAIVILYTPVQTYQFAVYWAWFFFQLKSF